MSKYKYYVVTADAVKAPRFEGTSFINSVVDASEMGFDVVPTLDDGFKVRYCVWACSPESVKAAFHKHYHDLCLRVVKESIDFREHDQDNAIILPHCSYAEEYCKDVGDLFALADFDVRHYDDATVISSRTNEQKEILKRMEDYIVR